MLKVCLVGNDYRQQFPIIDYGGIESCVENLAAGVYRYAKDKMKCYTFVPKIQNKGNITYPFPIIETNFIESSKSHSPTYAFTDEVSNIIKNSPVKPDIIWAQSDWSAKGLKHLGIPIISTMNDSGGWVDDKFIYEPNVYYRFVSKFLYDFTFENSNTNSFINDVKSKSFWGHTGLVDEEYAFEGDKENYILWVGGLHWGLEAKGLNMYIEMAKRRPDQIFKAYGTGDDNVEAYLKDIMKTVPNFKFMGKLNRGVDHKKVFQKARLFAMLSKIPEAFGRTGLEAISKGTPVLGTSYGSVPEQVFYNNVGYCTNDIDEMLKVIDMKFDYKACYEFSNTYHIKNEVDFMIKKSNEILNRN